MNYFDEETHLELMMQLPEGWSLVGYLYLNCSSKVTCLQSFIYKGRRVVPVYVGNHLDEFKLIGRRIQFTKLAFNDGFLTTYFIPDRSHSVYTEKFQEVVWIPQYTGIYHKGGWPIGYGKITIDRETVVGSIAHAYYRLKAYLKSLR